MKIKTKLRQQTNQSYSNSIFDARARSKRHLVDTPANESVA